MRRGAAAGGEPGEPGRNLLNGEPLPSKADVDLETGDVVKIETPGGGGYAGGDAQESEIS